MYFYVCICTTQTMVTKTQKFYMPNYLSFTEMYYNGHNANKRHWGVDIY